jgi:hypothetical protein
MTRLPAHAILLHGVISIGVSTAESGSLQQAGDYTTHNFNHFCDGTLN